MTRNGTTYTTNNNFSDINLLANYFELEYWKTTVPDLLNHTWAHLGFYHLLLRFVDGGTRAKVIHYECRAIFLQTVNVRKRPPKGSRKCYLTNIKIVSR